MVNQAPRCIKVLVTNIGTIVTQEDLLGFFSFCGGNADCRLSSDVGGAAQRALIDFGSQHAAQTALILSGAPLADRNIRTEAVEPRNAKRLLRMHVKAQGINRCAQLNELGIAVLIWC